MVRFILILLISSSVQNAFAMTGGEEVTTPNYISKSAVLIITVEFVNSQQDPVVTQCSGTLISTDLVLSAAHCFVPTDGAVQTRRIVIFKTQVNSENELQKIFTKGDGIVIAPGDYAAHENYRHVVDENGYISAQQRQWDVALVHLPQPAPASSHPVALLRDASVLVSGAAVVLAGYGAPNKGEHLPLRLRTLANVIAEPLVQPVTQLTVNNNFNGTPKGPSMGDSGGPGYIVLKGQPFLFGVYSTGQAYDYSLFSGYERVPDYIQWIEATAKKLGGTT